jgi:hypothetical protein
MSSTAIEMDLYNTSDCARQASRLTLKPGDCVDATGINLGQFSSRHGLFGLELGPWVKLSAPAEMPGGFQVVQYKTSRPPPARHSHHRHAQHQDKRR